MITRLFLFIVVLLCASVVLGCEREAEPTEEFPVWTPTPTAESQRPCERLGNEVIKKQKEADYGWYIVKLYQAAPSDPEDRDSTNYALFCGASALLSIGTRGGIDFFEIDDFDGDRLIGYRFRIWDNLEDNFEDYGSSLIVKK